MITKSQAKRKQDIKTKLMAAIAMLLVSSIMMVSSTYAWFTLSTAPEVTGIQTAVGANGNLEMALLPKNGALADITSEASDSTRAIALRNVTWGNLVDLGSSEEAKAEYGLEKITLYPSKLNINEAGKIDVSGFLMTPEYGADGRVSTLANESVTSYYDKGTQKFTENDDKGVRAIGTASGMTDRQLDYRNARSAANTARSLASTYASQSLNTNGSALANIAIKHGMGNDDGKYTLEDREALAAIINDLEKDGGVLDQIEKAYMQYIFAYAASSATSTDNPETTDLVWQAVKALVEAPNATLATVKAGLATAGVDIQDLGNIGTGIAKYEDTVTAVENAKTELANLSTDVNATYKWAEISAVMNKLANPTYMTVNGFGTSGLKENLGQLVSSVTQQGGLIVTIGTGGGVYADIADQSGNYSASVTIDKVEYNGIVLNDMSARMNTETKQDPPFLVGASNQVEGKAPAGTSTEAMSITDMYGYIIDLAFRTNAAESRLKLQVDAADRIYSGNTNEQTMGHGSSMTFTKTDTSFTDNQLIELMKAIKIVFFNPNDGTIYSWAKLNADQAVLGDAGWTAKMQLYTITAGAETYVVEAYAENSGKTYYKLVVGGQEVYTEYTGELLDGAQYYTKNDDGSYTLASAPYDTSKAHYIKELKDKYEQLTDEQAKTEETVYVLNKAADGTTPVADDVIMPLSQNTAQALSVLVYLDGEEITNADVAATGSTSMTGTMNLQFASTATLVPMEYADLHIPAGN